MTRVLAIGDSHFGPNERNADRYASLDQIIVWGTSRPLGAWLHAGDLNHAKMTIEDRNELVPRFQRMAKHAPVCMFVGNHDVDGDLRVFSKLKAKYPIVVIERPEVHRLELATGGHAAIFGVPYIHRGGLVGAGVNHDDLGQVARQLVEPVFMAAAHEMEAAADRGDLPVFLAHLAIGGALMSTGQPSVGREIEVDPGLLGRLGDIPKLLGHIHRHQAIHGAWYLGSIARMDHGENEEKVFGVLTFSSPREWTIEFEPLAVPAQHLIEGRLTRDGFTIDRIDGADACACKGTGVDNAMGSVTQCECGSGGWIGADVKVRYHYQRSERSAIDLAHIYATVAGCRSLKLDPIAAIEREVRAPEVAQAVTVEAKAEAYCTRRQIEWTQTIAAKLTALQQQSPEAILAAVSAIAADAGTVEVRKAVA